MKVREVIEQLSTLDPELEVVTWAVYDAETMELTEFRGEGVRFQ